MNIEIENYLSDDEIRQIVEEEFRNRIKSLFRTEKEITRIVTNLGYYNTFKIIENEVPNFKELIKEQTKKQCENISSYSVFRKKDAFESENSLAQDYLEEAVEENKEIINKRVVEIMNSIDNQDLADEICSLLEEKIMNLFKGETNK